MYSYYKYNRVSNVYNETDITNFVSNTEYKYGEHVSMNEEIKQYLNDVVLFHTGDDNTENKITFSRLDYEELLDMNVNETNSCSIIANLSNQPLTIIAVDMNIDDYTFKEYSLETKMNIIILEPNSHIFFDNLTVYGFINYDFIKNESVNSELNNSNIYLKIDIPKEYILDKKKQDSALWVEYNEKCNIKERNNSIELIDTILYDTSRSNIISIIKNKYKSLNELIINLDFYVDNQIDNKENQYKYGEKYNEIIKLKNGQNNIFDTNKLVINALQPLICDWIISEFKNKISLFELEKDFVDNNNFDILSHIEEIPNILQFCLFASIQHIHYFKQLYNLPDNLPINIIDMFICNNSKSQIKSIINNENTYIVLNYTLTTDNGFIKFLDTNDEIPLKQGDLLIYTSKKNYEIHQDNKWKWYSLIVLLDITKF